MPHRPSPCNLLIVEDDVEIGEAVHDALRADGHRVAVAADFAQAGEGVARLRFDLVLADAGGTLSADHGTDHATILARIESLAGYAPVLVLTPLGDAADVDLAARGFPDLLRKPFDLDSLRLAVCRTLAG